MYALWHVCHAFWLPLWHVCHPWQVSQLFMCARESSSLLSYHKRMKTRARDNREYAEGGGQQSRQRWRGREADSPYLVRAPAPVVGNGGCMWSLLGGCMCSLLARGGMRSLLCLSCHQQRRGVECKRGGEGSRTWGKRSSSAATQSPRTSSTCLPLNLNCAPKIFSASA